MESKTLIALLLALLAAGAVIFIAFKQYRWWVDFTREMTSFFAGEDSAAAQPGDQNLDEFKQQPEPEDKGSQSGNREP